MGGAAIKNWEENERKIPNGLEEVGGGNRGTDRRTLGGGHHLGSLRGPGPGGDTGGLSVREHPGSPPSPQVWGQFAQNGAFSAQTEARKRGVVPTFPSALRGSPLSLRGAGFGVLRAANLGGVTELGGRDSPQNPKPAAEPPLCPSKPPQRFG